MDFWVAILNRRNWWSIAEPQIYEGALFIINNYMSRTRFEVILGSIRYIDKKNVEYHNEFFHIRKME